MYCAVAQRIRDGFGGEVPQRDASFVALLALEEGERIWGELSLACFLLHSPSIGWWCCKQQVCKRAFSRMVSLLCNHADERHDTFWHSCSFLLFFYTFFSRLLSLLLFVFIGTIIGITVTITIVQDAKKELWISVSVFSHLLGNAL